MRALSGFDRGQGGIAEQCRLALRQGAESLAAAGLRMEDVVRVTYLVRDADAFPSCFGMLRDAFGDARPGATLRLVGGFDRPDMQIEIELVARRLP
ncbi:Rid family hydrolase [Lichenicoccus sp.]|uniref:Rid family hydrolase n=1 Tax=Lichenicoccus sp. TaxID=2781899 RepID=UPI003D0A727A